MPPYSETWFRTFLRTVPENQTDREVEFLKRQLPPDRFPRVLDLCCGLGRHSIRLARSGYEVTGIEQNTALVDEAPRLTSQNPEYIAMDMRDLGESSWTFDAALILWASFGFFESDDNDRLLRDLRRSLRSNGRLILDIYNREFFAQHEGTISRERAGRAFLESRRMRGNRLLVHLAYDDGGSDNFEWELFTPTELVRRVEPLGFRPVRFCTAFDEDQSVAAATPRYQAVLRAA